ncbi:hypothetical protein D3C81_1497320 [compost metagenome]
MQLQDELEEALAPCRRQQFAAVRIDVAALATALARRRGIEDARSLFAIGEQPDGGDLLARRGTFHAAHQFVQRQHASFASFHRQAGIDDSQQLLLERPHCARQPHEREHQPGADAEHPVQLEPDFLQHLGLTFNLPSPQKRWRARILLRTDHMHSMGIASLNPSYGAGRLVLSLRSPTPGMLGFTAFSTNLRIRAGTMESSTQRCTTRSDVSTWSPPPGIMILPFCSRVSES